MQERLEQVKDGARNAGLAVAMTLLVAVLGPGAFGVRGAFAQESTPAAEEADSTTDATTDATTEASEADAAYDEFVAGLAANLGTDTATVEAAITQSLTDMVDAKLAAGEISADRAAALTERITSGDIPIRLGWLGGDHGRVGPDDGRGGPRGGPRGDRDGNDDDDSTDGVGGGTTDEADPAGTPVPVNSQSTGLRPPKPPLPVRERGLPFVQRVVTRGAVPRRRQRGDC